jgi:hypothetical protein
MVEVVLLTPTTIICLNMDIDFKMCPNIFILEYVIVVGESSNITKSKIHLSGCEYFATT